MGGAKVTQLEDQAVSVRSSDSFFRMQQLLSRPSISSVKGDGLEPHLHMTVGPIRCRIVDVIQRLNAYEV